MYTRILVERDRTNSTKVTLVVLYLRDDKRDTGLSRKEQTFGRLNFVKVSLTLPWFLPRFTVTRADRQVR